MGRCEKKLISFIKDLNGFGNGSADYERQRKVDALTHIKHRCTDHRHATAAVWFNLVSGKESYSSRIGVESRFWFELQPCIEKWSWFVAKDRKEGSREDSDSTIAFKVFPEEVEEGIEEEDKEEVEEEVKEGVEEEVEEEVQGVQEEVPSIIFFFGSDGSGLCGSGL